MKEFLLYHDVIEAGEVSGFPGSSAEHYKLSATVFKSQVKIVQRSRPDSVVFTFDDAGISAMRAADILESFGSIGIFFAPTSFIGNKGFCSKSNLQELAARGHFIGSHSHTHPIPISKLCTADLRSEWTTSRMILEDVLGAPVGAASVPGGFSSKAVINAMIGAGFNQIFTSEPTRRVQFRDGTEILGRFSVTRSTTERDICRLAEGSSVPWWQQESVWEIKKVLKRLGGSYWLRARESIMAARRT